VKKQLLILPLVLFLSFTLLAHPCKLLADEYDVYRVIDGDTIKVNDGNQKITVRLVGIDAPEVSHAKNEPGQPFSQSSGKHLAALVLNRTVDITSYGQDRYGRTLGEVFVDGRNINLEMVKAGLAEVYRGTPAPGQNLDPYWQAEKEARVAKRGMWVLGDKYVSPREWRRMKAN
jgi:micrococcal nuclease